MKAFRFKRTIVLFGLILAGVAFLALGSPAKAAALSGSDWVAGRIIDDSVFFNPNTMSSEDIQNFLNAKVPTCDTSGTQPSGHPGYPTRADWGRANGYAPPYTCLKDYSQSIPGQAADSYCGAIPSGNMSAATIIKVVSAACNVNPQVILVTLQKEQALVTDDWPWSIEYQIAMGYGCPDTAACDTQYYGFFNQVYNAAHQFQRYTKQPQLFNFAVGQTSNVYYNPNSGCGYGAVNMQTAATAALYNYTPYQPNQAALNNLNGAGDSCSAYGNRNFWVYFWNWFGSPTGPEYAWLIDGFTYSGGDNNLIQGQTETLTLTARNVSRHPWYNSGDHPIRLGTWQPPDHGSPLLGGGTRYATLKEAVVNPNSDGTFVFQITPSTTGTFVEPMNLVAENATWMAWPGFSPTINVTNGYQWRVDNVLYNNGTGVMDPNTSQLITVFATNTGNVTWNKGGDVPIWLGTWPPQRGSQVGVPGGGKWPSNTRVTQMNDTPIAPGQQAGFQFYVSPPSGGNYYERLNLVAEGQSWFNDAGLTLYLHGNQYSWQPVWSSLSTGNPNIGHGQTFTITVRAKNTGDVTWYKNGNFPVRLGTANPLNRGSALETSSWLNSIRPTGLVENSVPPGGEGTFTFNATSPQATGPRKEYFNLVAEGITWFNDPGFYIYINSL